MTVTAPPPPPLVPPTAPPGAPPPRSRGARWAWIAAGLVAALVAVGFWVPSFIVSQFQTSHAALPPTRQVFTAPISAVTVDVTSGSVTVERGAGPGAVVESSGFRGQRTPGNHVRRSGHTLTITSSCGTGMVGGWCTRDYVVRVAPGTSVTAQLGTGAVSATGIDGPLKLETENGPVTVTDGRGPVQATSGTGPVTVTDVRGPVDAISQNGPVDVAEVTGVVQATSGTGSVTVAEQIGPTVDAHSQNGGVVVGFVQGATPPSQVTATSGTGAVTVHLPPGTTYDVHASSATGGVTTGVRDDPNSIHAVRASSADGAVAVLYGP